MLDEIKQLFANYGGYLIIVFLVFGLPPYFLIDTSDNTFILLSFKYVTIPFLIISYFYIIFLGKWREYKTIVILLIIPLIFSILVIFSSAPYLLYINLIGTHKYTYIGKIINKTKNEWTDFEGYKKSSWKIIIYQKKLNKTESIKIRRDEYNHLAIGDEYTSTWKIGCLGIKYKFIWE